jgi:hypothetical protein
MKTLIFESYATPDVPGYPDKYALIDGPGNLLEHGAAGCCPNPLRPSDYAPWEKAYGWLSCGTYDGNVVNTFKHGMCILLNCGNKLPAQMANANHDGLPVIDQVYVHAGDNDHWRGSAGCLTIPPDDFKRVIAHFELGETVTVAVIDYSKMGVAA